MENKMKTVYALIDGEIKELRVASDEIRGGKWAGFPCADTIIGLLTTNCGLELA